MTDKMKISVHDLAHSKGMPAAATEAMLLMQNRIEAQAAEIEDLKQSLEIWIFHHQRAMGAKPDVARQYAKAWMFRNANGEEPE